MSFLWTLTIFLGAGILTWIINHRLQRGAVFASAVVTLTAGLVLPELFAQGGEMVPMAACASYVSMSSRTRLGNVWKIVVALMLAAVLYTFASGVFSGVGGKGGTIAAICVLAVWGGCKVFVRFANRYTRGS
jgi:hypothetical protein